MNKQQAAIVDWQRGHHRQIEAIYGNMIKQARHNAALIERAKAWRLEKLRTVCQKARERMEQLQCRQSQ